MNFAANDFVSIQAWLIESLLLIFYNFKLL